MTTAVIRSFRPAHGLVIVKVDGRAPEVALRVCGRAREYNSTSSATATGMCLRLT
jgi:hypothetical protein